MYYVNATKMVMHHNIFSYFHSNGFTLCRTRFSYELQCLGFPSSSSMSTFDICSVLVFTGIYSQILVPLSGRVSGNPKGLTELQRLGFGLVIGMLAMVAAGVTKIFRLRHITEGNHSSSLSIFWQVPQYVLVGASEVFMYVGQLEFFNGQVPDGIRSFGSSLYMASISFGNFFISFLVNMVMQIIASGKSHGWIPEDLNTGHMDRFYFLIAGLTVVDLVVYIYCTRRYKSIDVQQNQVELQKDGDDDDDDVLDMV